MTVDLQQTVFMMVPPELKASQEAAQYIVDNVTNFPGDIAFFDSCPLVAIANPETILYWAANFQIDSPWVAEWDDFLSAFPSIQYHFTGGANQPMDWYEVCDTLGLMRQPEEV